MYKVIEFNMVFDCHYLVQTVQVEHVNLKDIITYITKL